MVARYQASRLSFTGRSSPCFTSGQFGDAKVPWPSIELDLQESDAVMVDGAGNTFITGARGVSTDVETLPI